LPVDEIERAFEDLIPICMELPTTSGGSLDNLLITPHGDLALIECKLWRNPEARRKVIGQIIDYATDLSAWNYEKLQEAIGRAKFLDGLNKVKPRGLYEWVAAGSEIDEKSFIDAVSRNLRRGRFLLLIVGDGIREGVESMTEFLQQHAGLHFTLAIVELALFEVPTGGYIAQPRVLARTTNIDRGTVTFDDEGRVTIRPTSTAPVPSNAPAVRMTITKERYLEQIEENFPGVTGRLNEFIGKLEMYGVFPDFGVNSMILRWPDDETKSWNLGLIASSGALFTDYLSSQARSGFLDSLKKYLTKLAALVPGASVKQNKASTAWGVVRNNRSISVDALLENEARQNGWLQAIAEFQEGVRESAQGDWQNAKRESGPSMSAGAEAAALRETVLEVGSEGGSITLLRERKAGEGWKFRMKTNESASYEALSEEDRNEIGEPVSQTGYVHSFREALGLLDQYRWFELDPIEVHPEYLDAVLLAVKERGGRGGATEETRWRQQLRLDSSP
jgi:hypothetical protein